MDVVLRGTVHTVHPIQEKNGYSSRKVWITIDQDTNYPQDVEVEFSGKNLDKANNLQERQTAVIHTNLRGKIWQSTSNFTTLSAWKVE